MPSPSKPRLCIFGDSHLGSVRKAVDAGLLDLSGFDFEFWGATGPEFRQIRMQDGVISASGSAREMVLQVNGHGRESIAAADFDVFLFYGARLRMAEFFAPYLHRMQDPVLWQSSAAFEAAMTRFLTRTRAYRFAAELAQTKAVEVYFASVSFPTETVLDHSAKGQVFETFPGAAKADAKDRNRLWTAFGALAARAGISLLPQPEHTVTTGMLTKVHYAVENAAQLRDAVHKSPEFAAEMLASLPQARARNAA